MALVMVDAKDANTLVKEPAREIAQEDVNTNVIVVMVLAEGVVVAVAWEDVAVILLNAKAQTALSNTILHKKHLYQKH